MSLIDPAGDAQRVIDEAIDRANKQGPATVAQIVAAMMDLMEGREIVIRVSLEKKA
jgi:hypothetical protein